MQRPDGSKISKRENERKREITAALVSFIWHQHAAAAADAAACHFDYDVTMAGCLEEEGSFFLCVCVCVGGRERGSEGRSWWGEAEQVTFGPSVRPSLSDSSSAAAESQNVAKRRRLGQARLFHFVMKTVARRRRRKGGNGSKKCTGRRRRRRRRLSKNIKTKHPKQQKVGKRKEGGNTHPIFHPFHSFWP